MAPNQPHPQQLCTERASVGELSHSRSRVWLSLLPPTHTMAQTLKHCAKCQTTRAPEGGVELRPQRWFCARCWVMFSKTRT